MSVVTMEVAWDKAAADTRLSLQGDHAGKRAARTLATNYGTYDSLVKERILHR